MQPSTQVKIATSVIQVLILVFAGFGTLIYQVYDADASDLSKNSLEVLVWVFMSVITIFVFPAYLLTLLLLAQVSGELMDILLFLLGGFITVPVLTLSALNLGISIANWGDFDWALYQRCALFLSAILVFIGVSVIGYHTFVEAIL